MTTGDPVRIGLAGYGRGGRFFHAPLIGQAPECTLAGVLTRSPRRRAELATDFPGVPAVGWLSDLAAAGVDAVVITTPLDTHERLVREAIALGLPAVCDKPFTPDAASARALVQAAEQSGVPLTVYQNRRWDADFLTVRALVESGALGEVTGFESRMEQYPPPGGFSATGGGVLRDFGSHVADQALHLFGPAARVYAEVDTRRPGAAVDDDAFIALTHENGVHSHLWMSAVCAQPGPRLRILGDQSAYTVQGLDPQEAALRAGERPGPGWGEPAEAEWGLLGTTEEAHRYPSLPGDYPAFYAGVVSALRDGAPAPVDPRDSLAALEVLELARRSAAEGKTL